MDRDLFTDLRSADDDGSPSLAAANDASPLQGDDAGGVRPSWVTLCVPDVVVDGYEIQRFNIDARECGIPQRRLRRFQFGHRDGPGLVVTRSATPAIEAARCCMASEGGKASRRSFSDFCELQGLPRDFDLPGLSLGAKYKAVGNGVPIPMGRVIAAAVRRRRDTAGVRVCVCECGRPVKGNQLAATASCRKRMERKRRDAAGVAGPGTVTGAASQTGGHQGVLSAKENVLSSDKRFLF